MVGSGEIEKTVEKLRPNACLIRSVRDRANKWCVVSPPVGAAIARDPASCNLRHALRSRQEEAYAV